MYSYIKAYEMILTPWDKTQSFLQQNEPFWTMQMVQN